MTTNTKIHIRQLAESDLPAADHMFRLAFGTFLGLSDPMTFSGDAYNVKTRFLADPTSTLAAESANGQLVGFNFVTNWGSVGYFGPLIVHPDYWDQGIAKQLLEPTMNIFDNKWHTEHVGLFTFAHSAKHVGLYQKFGFWPRFLTMIMSIPLRCSRWMMKSVKPTIDKNKIIYDAYRSFFAHTYRMMERNRLYWKKLEGKKIDCIVDKVDARKMRIYDDSVSLIVTSPPYVTSYEFADLHQLTAIWLGYIERVSEFRTRFIGSIQKEHDQSKLFSDIGKL